MNNANSTPLPYKDWHRALLSSNAKIEDAVKSLDVSALQIVLVVSPTGTLVGTITDGDIRRGLLRGLGMKNSIEEIIQLNPLVAPQHLDRVLVLQLMQVNKVHQLPIIDFERRLVGLHVWDEITAPQDRPNLMVIMAGGKGSRLLPLTENCPKPLLPVAGRPILLHIIEKAKAEGFKRFVLATHHLGHMIEDYFGDGSQWQVSIDYLKEDAPLGTAGALRFLDPPPGCPFLVSNGDVMTGIRYGELLDFHLQHLAVATMAVRLHEWQHPFGVVHTDGVNIIDFEEKPILRSHINAGIYVLEPKVLEVLDLNKHCDMPMLFERLQEKSARTIVYPIHEPWIDVGRPNDLTEARINSAYD